MVLDRRIGIPLHFDAGELWMYIGSGSFRGVNAEIGRKAFIVHALDHVFERRKARSFDLLNVSHRRFVVRSLLPAACLCLAGRSTYGHFYENPF